MARLTKEEVNRIIEILTDVIDRKITERFGENPKINGVEFEKRYMKVGYGADRFIDHKLFRLYLKLVSPLIADNEANEGDVLVFKDGVTKWIDPAAMDMKFRVEIPTGGVLPDVGESFVIYLTPLEESQPDNMYQEWIYVDDRWEKLGVMDLSNYYTKVEIDEKMDELEDAIEDTNERIDDVNELLKSKVDKFQAYNSQDAHDVHYIAKTTKVIVLDAENPTYTTQAEDQFGYGADVDSPVLEFVVNTSNAKIIMPYLPELNDRQVVLAKVSKDSEYKTCAFDVVKSDSTVVHTLGLAYGEGARDAAGNGKYKAMMFARYINEGVEQVKRYDSFGDSVALTKDASSIASLNFTGKTTKWQRVATIRFDQDMKSLGNDFNIKFGIYHYNSCVESTFVLQTRQKVFKEVLRTPGSANGVIEDICYRPIRVYRASGGCDAGEIWVKCRQDSRTDNIMQMHLYNVIAAPKFNPLTQYAAFNQNTSEHLMWVWENQHSDFVDYSPIGPWLDNKPAAIDSSTNTAILDCQMIPDEQEEEPIVPTTSVTLTDSAPTYTVDENSDSVISVINNCVNATGKVILNTLEDNKAVTFVVDDSSIQDLTIEDNTQSPAEATNVEVGYSAIASWNNTSEVWTVVAKSSDNTPVIEDYSNIEVNHVFHYDQIDNVSELETALQIFVTPLSGVYHEEVNEGDLILMVEPVNQARLTESDCGVDAGVYVIDKVEADQNFDVSSIIISKVAGVDKLNNIVGKNSGKFTEEGYWKVINGSIRKVHRQTDEVFAAHNEQPECPGEVVAIPIIGDAEAIASIEIQDKYKTNVGVIIDCSDTVIEFSEDEWYKHDVKKLTFNTIMIDDNSGGYVLNSKYNNKTCAIKFYVKVGDREPVLRTQMILLTAANILPTINNIFNHFATVYVLNASNEQYNGYSGHEAMNVILSSYDNPVNLVDEVAPTTAIDASSGYTVDGTENNAVNISNTSGTAQTVTLPTGASALSEAKTIIFVVADGSDDILFTDGTSTVTGSAGEQITCSWDGNSWTVIDGGQKQEQVQLDTNDLAHITVNGLLELDGSCRTSEVQTPVSPTADNVVAWMHPAYGQMSACLGIYVGNNVVPYSVLQNIANNASNKYIAIRDLGNIYMQHNGSWLREYCSGVYWVTSVEDTGLGYTKVQFGWMDNSKNLIYYITPGIVNVQYYEVYEVLTNGTFGDEAVYHRIGHDLVRMQPALKSGVSIKTVNGQSLLGSGNISISGGGGSGIQAASFVLYNLSGQITTVATQAYPLTLTAKFPQLGGRDWLSPDQTTGVISFTGAGVYKIEGGLGLTASSTNRVVRVKFSVLNNGVEVQGQTVNIGDTTAGGSGGNPSVVAIPSFEVLIESGWTLKIEFSTDTQSTITFDTTSSSIVITKTAEIS